MVSQSIANGSVQAINYFVAQKYIEALKEFAASPNQKIFMMPTDVTGVLGSIAGIVELTRDGGGRLPPAPPKHEGG
jgi:regulator of protease activity HflC (stomatin/prohibitin superfamily)